MISYNDIIEMARHVTKRSRGFSDKRLVHPTRDWLIGLSVAALVFVLLSMYAGWLFFVEQGRDATDYSVSVETTTYNHEDVRSVLELYRQKEQRFNELRVYEAVLLPNADEEAQDTDGASLSPNF